VESDRERERELHTERERWGRGRGGIVQERGVIGMQVRVLPMHG